MPDTEQIHPTQEARAQQQQALARPLGTLTMEDVDLAVTSFYGADGHFVGKMIGANNDFRSLISRDGQPNEAVGHGKTAGDAIIDTIHNMHSLETVRTKPILSMPMDKTRSVDFTSLEHYAPRIAPSDRIYEVPSYLDAVIKDTDGSSNHTYENTLASEDWSNRLFSQVETFLQTDPRGDELMRNLKVTSLRALTPEQAVKLSLATVQRLSKYSLTPDGKPDGDAADNATTMELLQQGIEYANDPAWAGNGVCRNIASNVKAVFEAFKAHQGNLSMLNNTYAGYAAGMQGAGYDSKRGDSNTIALNASGHAWNTFTTIDASGSANVVIVDATWALGEQANDLENAADYTLVRMADNARSLFEQSSDKADAFIALNDYYCQLGRLVPGEGPKAREQRNEFLMTEYLQAAALALPLLPEGGISAPPQVARAAYSLGDMLEPSELQTLYDMSKAAWINNFDAMLGKYLKGGKNPISGSHKINRMVTPDDGLQEAIYTTLGQETALRYAAENVDFKIRLRGLHADLLPPIDLTNWSDQKEIEVLASRNGLPLGLTARYGQTVRQSLRALTGSDAEYAALVGDQSDYQLLKNYSQLRATFSGKKS